MKVYVVRVLWRNDEDFGSFFTIFDTKEKAEKHFQEEVKSMKIDYCIEDEDISFQKDCAEYVSGDYDYCEVNIFECEVK